MTWKYKGGWKIKGREIDLNCRASERMETMEVHLTKQMKSKSYQALQFNDVVVHKCYVAPTLSLLLRRVKIKPKAHELLAARSLISLFFFFNQRCIASIIVVTPNWIYRSLHDTEKISVVTSWSTLNAMINASGACFDFYEFSFTFINLKLKFSKILKSKLIPLKWKV
jgi:hypothetical protein